jgi:hypothetical protein
MKGRALAPGSRRIPVFRRTSGLPNLPGFSRRAEAHHFQILVKKVTKRAKHTGV